MRINPNQMPDLLAALAGVQQQQNSAVLQLATGRRVNTPSDDPASAAQVILTHDRGSQVDSFKLAADSTSGRLQAADSTLSSVVIALQRALTLGVQGANGTLSNADRASVAEELSGVQAELVSLANLSYQGRFVFSGTEQAQPFVLDPLAPSGVRYDGNSGTNQIIIGDGYQLQMNLPGSQIFAAPAADMFQAINDLINAVANNTGIDAAVLALRDAFDLVTAQRVFYGNAMNQIEIQQNYLSGQKVQLGSEENKLVGADMASVASLIVNTENARNAALAAIGKVSQTSLFDFIG